MLEVADGRVEKEGMADHGDEPFLGSKAADFFDLRDRGRHWLFDQDVFAGRKRGHGQRVVTVGGSGNHYRVNFG